MIEIRIEQFDRLEWSIEVDGMLFAAGDCESREDGERQARAEIARAGLRSDATVAEAGFKPLEVGRG